MSIQTELVQNFVSDSTLLKIDETLEREISYFEFQKFKSPVPGERNQLFRISKYQIDPRHNIFLFLFDPPPANFHPQHYE